MAATKKETIVRMLKSKRGTTLDALMKATGWQHHGVRGLLSILAKGGFKIKSEGTQDKCYRITG